MAGVRGGWCGLLLAGALCAPAMAQSVTVENAWVRGTVPAQTSTGAFMEITSKEAASLVGVSSPRAATVEIHEMRMDGNVMKMRMLDKLELPAGATVPLVLEIETGGGKRSKLEVGAVVRDPASAR